MTVTFFQRNIWLFEIKTLPLHKNQLYSLHSICIYIFYNNMGAARSKKLKKHFYTKQK